MTQDNAIKNDSNSLNGLKLDLQKFKNDPRVDDMVTCCEQHIGTAWRRLGLFVFVCSTLLLHACMVFFVDRLHGKCEQSTCEVYTHACNVILSRHSP